MSLGINVLQGTRASATSPNPLNTEGLSRLSSRSVRNNRPDFPDSPFISNRPLRYNVQLNQQLTAVQQADDYLLETERQISQLHRATIQGKVDAEVRQLANKTGHWLQNRAANSAGTIDRQLNATPDRVASVNFTLDKATSMLQSSEAETVLFSLSDHSGPLVAVRFQPASSPEQNLLQLNKGLGRLGIHGKVGSNGAIHFRVDEARWPSVSQHLLVKGQGKRFAADSFAPLISQAETAMEDKLLAVIRQPHSVGNNLAFEGALLHLTEQLQRLNEHKNQVRAQISSLSCFDQPGSALAAATVLAQKLGASQRQYVAQAGMAHIMNNLHVSTVKNVIS
ncbi:flagellar hook-associated protein [Yersinia enterocolitica]|uniref:flagellar hook-associated protein n=1 Tax=Yersinia enterocolitica TaxID=630 RepID=UPI001C8D71F8|nr:flagellar hook-associated protein [Yersinia enterocolitica]MBX9475885.1 flagellar hook-associated protein [Yersinia enterocolitica]MBX9486443.1 flagellar hook-associated protein [Yersinia enterocolitica]MBX9490242.1 flagellar hook-associated protein [Yersinia enterocolitica]